MVEYTVLRERGNNQGPGIGPFLTRKLTHVSQISVMTCGEVRTLTSGIGINVPAVWSQQPPVLMKGEPGKYIRRPQRKIFPDIASFPARYTVNVDYGLSVIQM